jgi:hypothetical protein
MKADDVKNGIEIVKLLSDIIGSWVDRERRRREKEDERDERLKKLEAELARLRAEALQGAQPWTQPSLPSPASSESPSLTQPATAAS